jgi:hypothetical protein
MAFEELKERQSGMWGNGPYQNITETVSDIHAIVIKLRHGVIDLRDHVRARPRSDSA